MINQRYYWTYKSKAGFHVCDYIRLMEHEAKRIYGESLCYKLDWSQELNLS